MELGFIAKAMQRYWWFVAACFVLGLLPGLLAGSGGSTRYEASALLQITPPTTGAADSSADNDRYISGELVVLNSQSLAADVAERVGDGATAGSVAGGITFTQIASTSIVRIGTSALTPQMAQAIADGYADAYLARVASELAGITQPDLEALDEAITTVKDELADIDQRIQVAMAPYLPDEGEAADQILPTIDDVDPGLSTEKAVLLQQYTDLLTSRNQLELSTKVRVTSKIVQRAELPTVPITTSNSLLVAVGGIGGLLVGALLAVLRVRLAPTVLDEAEVVDTLGMPIAATIPFDRSLAAAAPNVLVDQSEIVRSVIDELCVRAEASARSDESFAVVVASAQRVAGGTTLAVALAARYAASGASVLLVDADPRHPDLISSFDIALDRRLELAPSGRTAKTRGSRGPGTRPIITAMPTSLDQVHVVGLGDLTDAEVIRRQNIPEIIATASQYADVVVFDTGPLLDAASTVELTELADAVVFAVPVRRQRSQTLQVAARQLRSCSGLLLPVATPGLRKSRPGDRRTVPAPSAPASDHLGEEALVLPADLGPRETGPGIV